MATDFSKYGAPTQGSSASIKTDFSKYGAPTTNVETTQPQQEGGFLPFAQSLIKAPIKSLLIKPAVRTGQALGLGATYAFGNEEQMRRAEELVSKPQEINLNIPGTNFGFGRYTIEPAKSNKQIAGEALEAGAYLIPGGKAAGLVKPTLKTLVKEGVKVGATSGGMFGAGTALQQEGSTAADIARQAATGAVIGGGLGAVVPLAFAGGREAVGAVKGAFSARTVEKAAQEAEKVNLIKNKIPEADIATKKLSETGKIVTDKTAKEVVRQGIPEADVALIKSGSEADKTKMIKMLDIRESQLTNKRVTDRATDVVGDTFINKIAKPIEKLNKDAGKRLDLVAQRLNGKKIDPTEAVSQFANSLDQAGVTIRKDGLLNFKNSNFEGLKGPQQLIQNVWNRARKVSMTGDALQLHRAKSYIDEIVNYGKEAEGLSGKAQLMLKQFRHSIDSVLDRQFPIYNKVNTTYTDTINELNKMGLALGRRFRLGDTFADAQAGLSMRRILSNTQSRAEILKMLDSMQQIGKKYGVKFDEDVVNQANFADILERMLGSEAPTSMLGQFEKGLESFGSSSGFGGLQQIGSAGGEFARGNIVRGTIKAGGVLVDVLRGVNQENKIKALRALLKEGLKKAPSNFGKK